jgi:serine/threonine protein kinase
VADDSVSADTSGGTCLIGQYGIAEHIYDVYMPLNGAVMIKLADFGTADINTNTMGQPIGVDHYTTLENTPPEQLFHGSNAVQDYAHDTFGLGLAILHMFTGQVKKLLMLDRVCELLQRCDNRH